MTFLDLFVRSMLAFGLLCLVVGGFHFARAMRTLARLRK